MLTKKGLYCFFIASIFYLISSSASAFNINRQFLLNTSIGYGYLSGQDILLNTIANEYPDLARDAYLAEIRFNTKFPNLKDKHFKVIESLDNPEINREVDKSTKELQTLLATYNQNLSKSEAIAFISEVNRRAKGEIESPILENFLVVQYNNRPNQEMLDGFYNTFSSKGLSKAKGIEVTLKLPKSWQQQEASRPNIVKKWISQNGTGIDSIMLMVKNLPETNISLNDIKMLYTTGEINETVPKGMIVLDRGDPIVVDRLPGYWYRIGGEMQRLDIHLYLEQVMYTVFYKDKIISIQCGSANESTKKSEVQLRVNKVIPLCKSIANSLVVQNRWQ